MIDYWNRTFASFPMVPNTLLASAGQFSTDASQPSVVATPFPMVTNTLLASAGQFSTDASQQPLSFATSLSTSVQRDSSKFSKQGASLGTAQSDPADPNR